MYHNQEVLSIATSIVQFRIDDDLKRRATEIYEKSGLDLCTALRIFLKRSVAVRGIPFSLTLDNDTVPETAGDNEVLIPDMLQQASDHSYQPEIDLKHLNSVCFFLSKSLETLMI